MRENRLHGSEGGEAKAFPTPIGLQSPCLAVIVSMVHEERAMPDVLSPAGDAESARVIAVVSSIPLAVDLGRYDVAEAAFAPQIVVDYTSLWGGEPQPVTPAALMDAWRGLVPGFDATRHELQRIEARVDGDAAVATARWSMAGTGSARRCGGRSASIAGGSAGSPRRWKVTAMTFAMTQEIGDRGLVAIAAERAKGR